MTQEDKELLLKDLCARLPYGIKCYPVITNGEPNTIGGYCETLDDFYIREVDGWFNISVIKPYLRPISSMTEDERKELVNLVVYVEGPSVIKQIKDGGLDIMEGKYHFNSLHSLNWLNKKGFDYRGLLEKGLALPALKNMYK